MGITYIERQPLIFCLAHLLSLIELEHNLPAIPRRHNTKTIGTAALEFVLQVQFTFGH